MAPLVASRTKKDIMDTWGIDQSLWERYERDPDLNGGILDFKKRRGTSETKSQFSDLLEKITRYSTMDVEASDDDFDAENPHAYDKGSHFIGGNYVGGKSAAAATATTTATTAAVATGKSTTGADAAVTVGSVVGSIDTGKSKKSKRVTISSRAEGNLNSQKKKERSYLHHKNVNRDSSASTPSKPRGKTSIKTTTTTTTTTTGKKTSKTPLKAASVPTVNRRVEEDDEDDDEDDDGNIEELKKTKKVKVREKKKIWGYDRLGKPVPCPFEAHPELPHQMYWENKGHYGEPIAMNLPSPHELSEEDMDPGLMKVKNIVKDLFDKKQKRFKDEAMAELNEIRGRILDIYSRYGIQWSFPDETEEERNKREARAQKKFSMKTKADEKAAKQDVEADDTVSVEEEKEEDKAQTVLVGGMALEDASKLTGIPPEKLLLMSEGMQDLMVWLQRKALEEEDRLQLSKEIEDSNQRAVQRTQVLLEANRWLQALGIDLTNPNIDCPYNDVAQNEMYARHHSHSGVNHNIFTRVSKLVAKTVVMGSYILQEYFDWRPALPSPLPAIPENINRLVAKEKEKTPSKMLREEQDDKALALKLTDEVRALQPPKGFYTDEELIVNAENWKIAVSSMEKQFRSAMDITYSKAGREKVEQCKRQAFSIKRTFEQQLSVISMRGAELGELQETLKSLQLELYDVKEYHRLREDVIKEKTTESDLWGFRVKELEHTIANFLRSIQMFDMEYRAAIPKIGKKVGEAMKYTSHITNAEEAKVKDKSEMVAFTAIGTSIKELEAKMTQTLNDKQEEQRQKQIVVQARVDAAKKKEFGGFPPPPPPTTDYSVIEPKVPSPSTQGGGKKAGKGKSKNASSGQRDSNFRDDEESDPEIVDHSWLGDAHKRQKSIAVIDFSALPQEMPFNVPGSSNLLSPMHRDGSNTKGSVSLRGSFKGSVSPAQSQKSSLVATKTIKLPPIDSKYLDLHK